MTTPLRLALPKGRLLDDALGLLKRAGISPESDHNGTRKLMFPDQQGRIQFVTLKPVDIPVYVESGAVDVGIVGSDVLRELDVDVYEPLDLGIGKCRLVLAAPKGTSLALDQELRVATKYPGTANVSSPHGTPMSTSSAWKARSKSPRCSASPMPLSIWSKLAGRFATMISWSWKMLKKSVQNSSSTAPP